MIVLEMVAYLTRTLSLGLLIGNKGSRPFRKRSHEDRSEIEGEEEKGESKHKRKREGKQMGPTQIHQLIETQTSKRCADPQDHKHQRKRDAYTHKYDRKQSRDHDDIGVFTQEEVGKLRGRHHCYSLCG